MRSEVKMDELNPLSHHLRRDGIRPEVHRVTKSLHYMLHSALSATNVVLEFAEVDDVVPHEKTGGVVAAKAKTLHVGVGKDVGDQQTKAGAAVGLGQDRIVERGESFDPSVALRLNSGEVMVEPGLVRAEGKNVREVELDRMRHSMRVMTWVTRMCGRTGGDCKLRSSLYT